jgi:hypothetical protein
MTRKGWTTVALSKRHICFLDKLSKRSKFSGGRKLSRTSILRAVLKAATRLDIDINQVKSEKDLRERLLSSFRGKV